MVGYGCRAWNDQSFVRRSGSEGLDRGTFRDSLDSAVNLCGSALGLPGQPGKPRTALYAGVLSGSDLLGQCSFQLAVPSAFDTKSCRLPFQNQDLMVLIAANQRKLCLLCWTANCNICSQTCVSSLATAFGLRNRQVVSHYNVLKGAAMR